MAALKRTRWGATSSVYLLRQCMITSRRLTRMECAAIALVILGIVLATVADSSVLTNVLGVVLSAAAILFSAVYQVTPLCPQLGMTALQAGMSAAKAPTIAKTISITVRCSFALLRLRWRPSAQLCPERDRLMGTSSRAPRCGSGQSRRSCRRAACS